MVSLIERTIRGQSATAPIKYLGSDKIR